MERDKNWVRYLRFPAHIISMVEHGDKLLMIVNSINEKEASATRLMWHPDKNKVRSNQNVFICEIELYYRFY